jgi:hypothetical protein
VLLVRPYPYASLALARDALNGAANGDVGALQRLYRDAAAALAEIDPDEVDEFRQEYPRAVRDDQALARAAGSLADTWEGIVAIASMLSNRDRFRGFVWLAAQIRYDLEPNKRDASRLRAYASGARLPDLLPSDEALYVALPALIGLGPELPEEVAPPMPVPAEPVARLLGLPEDDDWAGLDPLDGFVISPDTCRAHYAAAPPAWQSVLARGLQYGLIVRSAGAGGLTVGL